MSTGIVNWSITILTKSKGNVNMANKRFYWLKLKEDFLLHDDGEAAFMLNQPNGAQYVVLYLMLCLKSVNTGGKFITKHGNIVAKYTVAQIQQDCKYFSIDTVRVALELFRQMGLVYEDEEGITSIKDFDEIVGSETDSARRMRRLREAQENQLLLPDSVTMCAQCDIEKDKDIKRIEENTNIRLDKTTTACTCVNNDPLVLQEVTAQDSWGVPVSAALLISNSQIENLHKFLSRDELAHYLGKMREMLLNDYKFPCSHYNFILKMVAEDRKVTPWQNGNS